MSKSESGVLSGTYAQGVLRGQAGVGEDSVALQQQDLGEDGDGDLARRLVAETQPDRRVQPRIVARVAAEPLRDAPEDQGDLPPAADQPDVPRRRAEGSLEDRLVERVAAGEDHHEVGRPRGEAAERVLRKIGATHVAGAREALAGGKLLPVVEDGRVEADLCGDVRHPLSDVAGAVED